MSGYNNYEARPADVKRAIDGMQGLQDALKKMAADFQRTEQGVEGWNGEESDKDDFFRQTDPQYRRQNEGCRKFQDSLREFVAGLQSATTESLRSINKVSNAVQDEIGAAKVNAEKYRSGGHGKR
ncbi:hypothetical protein ACWC5C_20890 [Streptomyces sp. NPDC001700]